MRSEFAAILVWCVPFDGETVAATAEEASMRVLMIWMMLLVALVSPVLAQENDSAWKASVTGQIEALRDGDGAAALEFAAAGFRTQFAEQPEAFYAAILASGYAAIAASRSHSFGNFEEVSETTVLQVVSFVGPDQELYEAVYQLANEPDEGWRVQSVVLRKQAGIAI